MQALYGIAPAMLQGFDIKRFSVMGFFIVAAFGLTMTPAYSQDTLSTVSEGKSQVYTPDYFTQFAPQTAADMVARLPGFEIRGNEGGARGFGEASLNILINGRRPSSKSSGANQILGRIPANNVTRIEIVDGASLDIPGLSGQVANIFAKTGELSGSWEYALRFEEGSQPQLGDGKVNFSGKRGNLELVGELNFGQFLFTEDGEETFFDGAGTVLQDREEKTGFNTQRPRANLNLTLERDNGHIANLNLSGTRQNTNITVFETFEDQTDPIFSGASEAINGSDRDSYEISGDYSLSAPLLGRNGQLKFIGLHRGVNFDFTSGFLFDDGDPGQSESVFLREDEEREFIGRAEYSWQTGETSDWTASIEGALNTLESTTELTVDGDTDPEDFVEVDETRIQGNLSRSWALNDKTNLQVSIGAEYSEIDVPTSTQDALSFFRPKGLFSASRKLDDSWTIRGQVERTVGQLDFGTFVSTVGLVDGTATQGNDQIFPEQSWEAELELEKQSPTGLSGRATLFYNLIEDPIEQIPFIDADGTLNQGPGNLDTNATSYGVTANLTWVLDEVLSGLRLTAEGALENSSIEDVVTLDDRNISRGRLWEYSLEGRWDIQDTPFALEAEVEQSRQADRFRIDERIDEIFRRPEFEVSIIHKDLFGMQWTATLQNILDFELRRERFIFDETRNGGLIQRELVRRQRGARFSLEITDTF